MQEEKSTDVINRVFPGWNFETNYDYHRLGRIWVIWSEEVTVTVLFKSPLMITMGV